MYDSPIFSKDGLRADERVPIRKSIPRIGQDCAKGGEMLHLISVSHGLEAQDVDRDKGALLESTESGGYTKMLDSRADQKS